jgi:predicted enzyme related to lactoylglutathione lyase
VQLAHRASSAVAENQLSRHGGLTYLEVPTLVPAESAAFYEHVLGWTVEERGPEDLRFRDPDGHLIGRWMKGRDIHASPGLVPYFYVDDIDEAVRQVAARGGEVVEGPRPEGNLRVAQVRDPAGNLLGLWQAPLAA